MSILDPVPARPINAAMVAAQMKAQARSLHAFLVRTFNDGAVNFWKNANATPEQIADALGNDGRELFQLHARIGALLAEINPADIAVGAAAVGKFTYSPEGKVLVEQPLP